MTLIETFTVILLLSNNFIYGDIYRIVIVILSFLLLLNVFFLLLFHYYLMIISVTTWEYFSWSKISYLEGFLYKNGSIF